MPDRLKLIGISEDFEHRAFGRKIQGRAAHWPT